MMWYGGCACVTFLMLISMTSASTMLQDELQKLIEKHSSFWNASFSFAIYNASLEVAVAAGQNNYADSLSRLTTDGKVPMGSATKPFTAVSVLRLAKDGNLSLDDPIAPLVDRYLANPLPCSEAPSQCGEECVSFAHCYTKPSILCKMQSLDSKCRCSYCFRYLHCFSEQHQDVPKSLTLQEIWDNDARIQKVTFRHLLSMNSGIQDYYFDPSNWLYNSWISSTRDIEPMESLVQMNHTFLFEPGDSTVVPQGKPGAGQTVLRGSYSTNGFSLIGLAICGLLNLTSWTDLNQKDLAWGAAVPADDTSLFPTRGTCLEYPGVVRQYTSSLKMSAGSLSVDFEEISNHSCLNSWLGGNIAARPLDLARFMYNVFGTDNIIGDDSREIMTTLHPMTDGVYATYQLAYGLGLEGSWGNEGADLQRFCGYKGFGHGGLDYGSGVQVNAYFPDLKLGLALAMTSGINYGSSLAGMACSRNYEHLGDAYWYAFNELFNAVSAYTGNPEQCPRDNSYTPPSSCVDAPSFGTINGNNVTCAILIHLLPSNVSVSDYCKWFSSQTLTGLAQTFAHGNPSAKYIPPAEYNPNTTLAVDLCRDTCMAVGVGPCWMLGPHTEWCEKSAAPIQNRRSQLLAAQSLLQKDIETSVSHLAELIGNTQGLFRRP